jgi:hypothetical protein
LLALSSSVGTEVKYTSQFFFARDTLYYSTMLTSCLVVARPSSIENGPARPNETLPPTGVPASRWHDRGAPYPSRVGSTTRRAPYRNPSPSPALTLTGPDGVRLDSNRRPRQVRRTDTITINY